MTIIYIYKLKKNIYKIYKCVPLVAYKFFEDKNEKKVKRKIPGFKNETRHRNIMDMALFLLMKFETNKQ